MYGSASLTAVTNSGCVALSTMNELVSANPVVSTTYRADTDPMMCALSSLRGYAGAALFAERTTAVSTSRIEYTESGPDVVGISGAVTESWPFLPAVSSVTVGRASPIMRGPSPNPIPSVASVTYRTVSCEPLCVGTRSGGGTKTGRLARLSGGRPGLGSVATTQALMITTCAT